jgi:hypothetical protein
MDGYTQDWINGMDRICHLHIFMSNCLYIHIHCCKRNNPTGTTLTVSVRKYFSLYFVKYPLYGKMSQILIESEVMDTVLYFVASQVSVRRIVVKKVIVRFVLHVP